MTEVNTASEKLIVGDYYQGAFGPTLLIRALYKRSVRWLHDILSQLAETGGDVDLIALPEVSIQGVRTLKLELVDEQPEVALRLQSSAARGVDFLWRQDVKGWRAAASLIEPFLSGQTGHQYLTQEGRDEVLIEISFGESSFDQPA